VNPFTGGIAEILSYDTMGIAAQEAVECYLGGRYGAPVVNAACSGPGPLGP